MENKTLTYIKNNLIVSCQALEDEPLHSSFIMSRMALAAVQSGALGIRANSVEDIKAIQETVRVPIIGILKKVYPDSPVFITPTLAEVRKICQTGVEIVAMDATLRKRPNDESLNDIVSTIRTEYPNVLLMADTSSIADIKNAEELGFDIIGTTLYGYTDETRVENVADNDFYFLKEVLKNTHLPVIAEGKIDIPSKARRVLELGCHSVVVGGAITRPQQITKTFVGEINKLKRGE